MAVEQHEGLGRRLYVQPGRQHHAGELLLGDRELEVVVVNGPSTDDTQDVLAEFGAQIKAIRNPLANLSVSRNLGIRAAAGDIVAFIDDDALPESNWLEQALSSFDDPEVGAVGGIVLDHTGMQLQYRFSTANRLGEATFPDEAPAGQLTVPGAPSIWSECMVWIESITNRAGGGMPDSVVRMSRTDVAEASAIGAPARPRRSARIRTWPAASSPLI